MRVAVAIAVVCLSSVGLCAGADVDAAIRKPTNIPAQPLGQALQTLAKDRGFQVVYVSDEVDARTTHGASGDLTIDQALTQILDGTGLTYQRSGDGGVSIVPVGPGAAAADKAREQSKAMGNDSSGDNVKAGRSFWDRFRLAQVDQGQTSGGVGSGAVGTDNSPAVEEVVVTAQKRPERLQDIPVAVSVINNVALAQNHISSIGQIQQISPSVSFTDSANTRGDGLSIRGIGTLNFSDGVEPSVSTVVDGVVIGRSAAAFFDFNDIERIEILRGPQGTLFGKNSSAGVVNIVTARPDLHAVEADGSISYGQLNELKVKGSASVPLIQDTLALRVTSFYDSVDGLVHNLYNGNDLNGNDSYGARAKLLFKPSEVFDAYFIADYAKSDGECCVSTARSIWPTTRYFGPTGPLRTELLSGIVPGSYNLNTRFDGRTFDDQDTAGVSLEMNAHLGNYNLTSISAYRQFHDIDNNDTDNVPVNILNLNDANQYQHQFSEELRLTSPADQVFEYVVGAYFFDQTVATRTDISGTLGQVLPSGVLPGNYIDRAIQTKNGSLFGQGTLHLGEHLRLIGGARQTHEQLDARFLRTVPSVYSGPVPGLGGPPLNDPSLTASDNNFSYKAGLQYDFTPDFMVYASYTRGYKGKAINLINGLSQSLINSGHAVLNPEIPKSYEVGARTSWLDRRLILNLTGFWTNFNDFQSQSYDPTLLTFTLANAGNLRSRGIEGEATYTPFRGLNLATSVVFTDNNVDDYVVSCYAGQTAAQGCIKGQDNVSGARLVNSPKWAFTLSGDYTHGLGFRDYDGFISATYTYRSWVNFSFNDPHDIQPGYGVLNLNLGVETGDRRYKVFVFAKNALDKHYALTIGSTAYDSSAAGSGYSGLLTEDSRRIVGIEFDASL
jgi:iron complex outermembrane receptor protein